MGNATNSKCLEVSNIIQRHFANCLISPTKAQILGVILVEADEISYFKTSLL